MIDRLNIEIGERLKEIRGIINEGGWLSSNQLAYLLGISGDVIRNIESGRTSIPAKVLADLYRRGINPVYIISGEGSIFADNSRGKELYQIITSKEKSEESIIIRKVAEGSGGENYYRVAAGKFRKKDAK